MTIRMLLLGALIALAPSLVSAKKMDRPADEAAAVQARDEMKKGAQKGQWGRVERSFSAKYKNSQYAGEIYYLAAQAARADGDVGQVIARLTVAKAKNFEAATCTTWLADINANYGKVKIAKQKKGERALPAVPGAFKPDFRAAIDRAKASITKGKKFSGYLPKGQYTIGTGRIFTVAPGVTTKVGRR